MAISRYEPGTIVSDRGAYALVGHYGEPTGVTVWREAGECLPLVSAGVEYPLWFFLVVDAMENVEAA
jgi:hypothetical protein